MRPTGPGGISQNQELYPRAPCFEKKSPENGKMGENNEAVFPGMFSDYREHSCLEDSIKHRWATFQLSGRTAKSNLLIENFPPIDCKAYLGKNLRIKKNE